MTIFFSILIALMIEQLKPLRADNPVYGIVKGLVMQMETWFNAGQVQHGRMAWCFMMLALMGPTAIIYFVMQHFFGDFGAFLWNIVIVYLTMGFRHYSHYFTSIQLALSAGDEEKARGFLSEWTGIDAVGMEVSEISRIAVEKALVTTHRSVFGVFFWFLMPIGGPACAVMYRVAEYLARAWNEPDHMKNEVFGQFATRAFYWIDWIPVRLTAVAFALLGNFEDAIYAWRNFAGRWKDEAIGIILAAGGGAMGVRLGTPLENASNVLPADAGTVDASSSEEEAMPGEEPTPRALQSTVALVWRSLLLWMLLLLLLSGAVWVKTVVLSK